MIKQLGYPTWFALFSAAETRWLHLLKILGRLVDNHSYADLEIKDMSWLKKCELIQKDPVSCARNFEHMVQNLIHNFLKSNEMPLGEIVDFFYRVEFQQRGSPHIHALFWIKDAPVYGQDPDNLITSFVDKYVTCAEEIDCENSSELINLQTHQHSKTCKKRNHNICRFNFPLPPMPKTTILTPLDHMPPETSEPEHIKKNYHNIQILLNEMKHGHDMTFDDFVKVLDIDQSSYILAIRYSLKRQTLFLRRTPKEIRINNYNHNLLAAWQANMDLQYVLDPYACAVYILSYITKGQRGMSKLLEEASNEAWKSHGENIPKQIRHIGNKFLNAVEISAQEAVYLPLKENSGIILTLAKLG